MTTNTKPNAVDTSAKLSMADANKEIKVSIALSGGQVDLTKRLAGSFVTLENGEQELKTTLSGKVQELRVLILNGDYEKDFKANGFNHYQAVRNVFMNEWQVIRKCEEDSARKAFNRYFGMTDLDVPLSNDPEAMRKRAKKEAEAQKLSSIADLDRAMADAVAVADFDLAKKVKNEKTRRLQAESKEVAAKLKEEIDPIKESIKSALKDCHNKALLIKVAKLLQEGK
jgi:hypothetical protein